MIFVTGIQCSGLTVAARVLAASGAAFGIVDGRMEHPGIREEMLKPYLRNRGMDPRGQRPLPDLERIHPLPDWHRQVLRHVPGQRPAIKDHRIALTWPLWAEAFPDATWVIVRRDEEAVVRSCMRSPAMTAFAEASAWRRWVEEQEDRIEDLKAAIAPRWVEVWALPNLLTEDRTNTGRRLAEMLGLSFDRAAAREAVAVGDP